MDAKRSANSARTVTTLTKTISAKSCLKTAPQSMRTENASNVKTVTISIATINASKSMIANKTIARSTGG